jgi:hypothetical protein
MHLPDDDLLVVETCRKDKVTNGYSVLICNLDKILYNQFTAPNMD